MPHRNNVSDAVFEQLLINCSMTNTSVINMLHNDFITCITTEFVIVSRLTSQRTFCTSIRNLLIHCADYSMVLWAHVIDTTWYVLLYRSACAVEGLLVDGYDTLAVVDQQSTVRAVWGKSISVSFPLVCQRSMPLASGVFKGGSCARPPFGRTAVIFVTILGLFVALFRDKIAATSDQMRFLGRKML